MKRLRIGLCAVFIMAQPPSVWGVVIDPYAWQFPQAQQITGADDLILRLQEEAQAILNAGRLAPLRAYHADIPTVEEYWLYQEPGRLITTLADVDCVDRDIQRGLAALRRTLVRQRAAGTPWHARDAADVLAILDQTAWISVLGLLDECPIVPAALTAILEGRKTTISPTAFEFISTAAQVGDVRTFMRRLPDLLSR